MIVLVDNQTKTEAKTAYIFLILNSCYHNYGKGKMIVLIALLFWCLEIKIFF